MKWKVRKPNARRKALCRWHRWFAWYPARVPTKGKNFGQTMVWLSIIERKGIFHSSWGDEWFSWKYR
jgi:hypothetical protein